MWKKRLSIADQLEDSILQLGVPQGKLMDLVEMVCVYICMYICIYVYMYFSECPYLAARCATGQTHGPCGKGLCICMYMYAYIYVYMYIYMCIYICICVYICVRMYMNIYICMYICVYVYIYTYICTYVYMYS